MPELRDMSRDSWEDAEVDVGLIPVFVPFGRSTLSSPTVGCIRVL